MDEIHENLKKTTKELLKLLDDFDNQTYNCEMYKEIIKKILNDPEVKKISNYEILHNLYYPKTNKSYLMEVVNGKPKIYKEKSIKSIEKTDDGPPKVVYPLLINEKTYYLSEDKIYNSDGSFICFLNKTMIIEDEIIKLKIEKVTPYKEEISDDINDYLIKKYSSKNVYINNSKILFVNFCTDFFYSFGAKDDENEEFLIYE